MTEPIYSGPTPLTQFPVQGTDPFEADPNSDGQLPPDPLLESGTFIDVVQNGGAETVMPTNLVSESAAAETTTATGPEDAVGADVTPLSQRQKKKLPQELVERPSWLPEDWKVEVRVRTSGATAGTTDRYFFTPSGNKLRSKKEVLHYLETGSKPMKKLKSDDGASASDNPSGRKRKLKTDDGASASGIPSGRKQRKSKANLKNLSGLNYDFKNPPQAVEYTMTDEGNWKPSVDNVILPESQKAEWDTAFSHVTQLDSSRGAY